MRLASRLLGHGFAAASVVLVGCGETTPLTDGAAIRMEFGEGGFFASPFPSEHRRRQDGTTDVAGFPNPGEVNLVSVITAMADASDGFGTTSGVFFQATAPLDESSLPPSLESSLDPEAPVLLLDLGPEEPPLGRAIPVDVGFRAEPTNHGAPNRLGLVPLQGRPLRPRTLHAAVVRTSVQDGEGKTLAPSAAARTLAEGGDVPGLGPAAAQRYREALGALEARGIAAGDIAGLAVFETAEPTALYEKVRAHALSQPLPELEAPFALIDTFDDYCVFGSTLAMPTYQAGTLPYAEASDGGAWAFDPSGEPVVQGYETARIFVTVPRAAPMPAEGFPAVVFSRTGGGGDKPLIDRGVHDASGMSAPGTGYAREFALAGLAGISVDGPHGGPRNPTGGDEQFLVYNVQNPLALRDNIRQSALELSLTAHLAGELSLDASACPGLGAVTFDPTRLAAFGHSMGAVIVPIAAASEPLFGAVALSGAGSSFIENILYKQSPIATKAFAELLLGYVGAGMELDRFDPVLSLLQWAGEASDPPVYGERMRAAGVGPHAFVVQGIVDTYILPPIASATNLSFGITQGGEALDASAPGLETFRPLGGLLPLAGLTPASLPATAQGSALRVVVQHAEDGLEDGHEIAYQSSDARAQVACFLATYASGGAPTAVAKGGACP